MRLREFYWKCNADYEAWQRYSDLVTTMLVLHDRPAGHPLALPADHIDALKAGDAFRVHAIATGATGPTLLDFFTRVNGDATIRARFASLHNDLIAKYGPLDASQQ